MRVMTLDPKKTHEHNPDCPSRLMQHPHGGWYCLDCGAQLCCTSIEVAPVNEPPLMEFKLRSDRLPNAEQLEAFMRMMQSEEYNLGAPVDGFDRSVNCCYASSGTTGGNARAINQSFFTSQPPALLPDFMKQPAEVWKARTQEREVASNDVREKLKKILGEMKSSPHYPPRGRY